MYVYARRTQNVLNVYVKYSTTLRNFIAWMKNAPTSFLIFHFIHLLYNIACVDKFPTFTLKHTFTIVLVTSWWALKAPRNKVSVVEIDYGFVFVSGTNKIFPLGFFCM